MKIIKKIKCNKCEMVIEDNGTCTCGNLTLVKGAIVLKEGTVGIDCEDISPQLLNENA